MPRTFFEHMLWLKWPQGEGMTSKYEPLRRHLAGLADLEWSPTFRDIEGILGAKLPASAGEHRTWWANHGGQMVHQNAWIEAGWRVEAIDLGRRAVTFRKVRVASAPKINANPSADIEIADLSEQVRESLRQAKRAINISVRLHWQIVGRASRKGARWSFPKGRSERAILRLHLVFGDDIQVRLVAVENLSATLAGIADGESLSPAPAQQLADEMLQSDAVIADAVYADQAWIVADGRSRKADMADPADLQLAMANILSGSDNAPSIAVIDMSH